MKFKSNFSFARMLKRAESKTFQKKTSESVINPMVKDSKEFIKSNKVTPATTTKTLEKRRKRKTHPSISQVATPGLVKNIKFLYEIQKQAKLKRLHMVIAKVVSKVGGMTPQPGSPLQHVTNVLKRKIRPNPVTGHAERIKTLAPVSEGSGNGLSLL